MALRVGLLIYCVSLKLAKCAIVTLLGFLMPLLTVMTIIGTVFFNRIRNGYSSCYPDDASPWSMIFCLCIGWFLTYIYILLGCSALYNRVSTNVLSITWRINWYYSWNLLA